MSNFSGGSAYGMANQISQGYTVVNPLNLKRMSRAELGKLQFELQRIMTDLRSQQPGQDDTVALQTRNRKISRVRQALQVIEHRLHGR
jgi:hypothetical protein